MEFADLVIVSVVWDDIFLVVTIIVVSDSSISDVLNTSSRKLVPDNKPFSEINETSVVLVVVVRYYKNWVSCTCIINIPAVVVSCVFILLPFDPILSGCQYSDEAGSLSSSKVSRRCDPKRLPKDYPSLLRLYV